MTTIPQDLAALCAKGAPAKHYFYLTTGETLVVRTAQLREIKRIKPFATAYLDEAVPAPLEASKASKAIALNVAEVANASDRRTIARVKNWLGKEPSAYDLVQYESLRAQTERVCAKRIEEVAAMVPPPPPPPRPRLVIAWETGRLNLGTVQK